MSLKSRRQSILQLNPTVLQTRNGRPILFDCLSPTSKHSYSISISAFKSEQAVCGYRIHCRDKSAHSVDCQGNARTVCKHSLASFIKRLSWQGLKVALCEKFEDAKRLLNLYAKKAGKLVEIRGNGVSKFAIVWSAK